MFSLKKRYLLVAICLKCNSTTSTEVETEPENLTAARLSYAKRVAAAHTKHPSLNNFDISAKQM